MTDPITCPECGGEGVERLGPLALACRFCQGAGEVGGENEPAEDGQVREDGYRQPREGEAYDPDVHGPLPSVQDHPAVQRSGLCTQCLGAGSVMIREPVLRVVPCPACQRA